MLPGNILSTLVVNIYWGLYLYSKSLHLINPHPINISLYIPHTLWYLPLWFIPQCNCLSLCRIGMRCFHPIVYMIIPFALCILWAHIFPIYSPLTHALPPSTWLEATPRQGLTMDFLTDLIRDTILILYCSALGLFIQMLSWILWTCFVVARCVFNAY